MTSRKVNWIVYDVTKGKLCCYQIHVIAVPDLFCAGDLAAETLDTLFSLVDACLDKKKVNIVGSDESVV